MVFRVWANFSGLAVAAAAGSFCAGERGWFGAGFGEFDFEFGFERGDFVAVEGSVGL